VQVLQTLGPAVPTAQLLPGASLLAAVDRLKASAGAQVILCSFPLCLHGSVRIRQAQGRM
jgi:hypothetical protein